MIQFYIGDYAFNVQFIPVYGLATGFLYYDPTLEPDGYDEEDDMFYQINILLLFFGIQITAWKFLS